MKQPYKHLDIPKQHLSEGLHFVPPKARTASERERRHGRPPGTLLAECEFLGLQIARHLMVSAEDLEDVLFAARALAPAALNTAWYRKARESSRMRKVAHLPMLALGDAETRPSSYDLCEQAKDAFGRSVAVAHGLVQAYETQARDLPTHRAILGNVIGDASLLLAAIEISDAVRPMRPFQAQAMVREQGLAVLGIARSMGTEIGTHPSLAQLADPDSDFAVHLRRTALPSSYEALEEATAYYSLPR